MAHTHSNQDLVLVAIDVSKRFFDVLIKWPNGVQKFYKIQNSHSGHEDLTLFLSSQKQRVRAALEPTADYHRTIAYNLAESGVEVHLASSLACARVREALFNSWDKHDRKDAKVIMYLLENQLTKPFYDPLRNGYLNIQELSNTYHQIAIARSRCQHSLMNHYLTLFFPEIERFLHTSRAEWLCRFMLEFPTPQSILSLELDIFIERAWKLVGRKVSKKRLLTEIYETAQKSIGLPVPENDLAIQTFRLQIQRYLDLTLQRKQLELWAEQTLGENRDYQRLKTLPGVGPIIALTILAESGDLKRFSHHRKYLKFCGFDLSAQQSGQSKTSYKLSKRGNARLRYSFWLAATNAIRQRENSFRAKYERYIAQDPANRDLRRKAYTAVAVKMARVAHALIKNDSDYRGYYEAAIPGGRTLVNGP